MRFSRLLSDKLGQPLTRKSIDLHRLVRLTTPLPHENTIVELRGPVEHDWPLVNVIMRLPYESMLGSCGRPRL